MRLISLAAAALLALGAAFAPAAQAATAVTMTTGYYSNVVYVVSANATNGGSCVNFAGETILQTAYYPGPNAAGYTVYFGFTGSGGNGIVVIAFPTTQKAGATTPWTGTATVTVYYNGTVSSPTSQTFSSTSTVINAFSSYGTTTISQSVGTNQVCTEVLQFTSIFTGIK